MTIYTYTLGTNGLGGDTGVNMSGNVQTLAGSFSLDTAWFNSDGTINTTIATAANIYSTLISPTGSNGAGDAYFNIGTSSVPGNAYVSGFKFYTDQNQPGSGTTIHLQNSNTGSSTNKIDTFTLSGDSTNGYDLFMKDSYSNGTATNDAINIHFSGIPSANLNGLNIDNSKSYVMDSSSNKVYFDSHDTIVCFAKGALISTAKGLVAVEKLKVGDQVLTIDGEHAPIVWLGHRRVNCLKHSQPELANPVRVSKDAFGPGMPSADVFLSPAHAVYAYGHLVPVRHLINDVTITQESVDSITYYHIELPKHTVIFAQGLPAETYLDSDNRQFFISADQPANVEPLQAVEFSESYGRDLYLANCYAPFVTEGPVLEAIQEKLMGMPAAVRLAMAA